MAEVVVYKYADIEGFFQSCALTHLLHQSLSVIFVKSDSGLAKIGNMLGMNLGSAQVQQSTRSELLEDMHKLAGVYMKVWLQKLHELGPDKANAYIDFQVIQRQQAIESMQNTYAEVRRINGEIVERSESIVSVAAKVKLGAAVGVALISGGTGILFLKGATAATSVGGILMGGGSHATLVFTGVNITGSFVKSVAKNYESSYGCRAAAIDFAGAASPVIYQNGIGLITSQIGINATERMLISNSHIVAATTQITEYSKGFASNIPLPPSVAHNINAARYIKNEAIRNHSDASRTLQISKFVGPTLNVVFATKDIIDGVLDYRNDTQIIR